MKTKHICLLLTLILLLSGAFFAQEKTQEKELFEKAKKSIYEKEWQNAINELNLLTKQYNESELLDDSLYWLGYSLDKMGDSLRDVQRQIDTKQEAVEKLNALIQEYQKSSWADDAKVLRIQIAEDLVKRGMPVYRKYINGSLQSEGTVDSDEELKLMALSALINMDEEKAFPMLEKIVRGDSSPKLKKQALFVLSQHEDEKVLPLITELAVKSKDPELRKQAVFWLGQRNDDQSMETLLKLYDDTASNRDKEQMLHAFANSENRKARSKLIEIAKKESDLKLREQAIFWLGQAGDEGEYTSLLIDLYKTVKEPKLKEVIVMSLARNGGPQARDLLIDIARGDSDIEMQEKAIFWLAQEGGDDITDLMQNIYAKTSETKIKQMILHTMAQKDTAASVEWLIATARKEKDFETQKTIIFWLGQSENEAAVKYLRELLEK